VLTLTKKQEKLNALCASDATHIMAYGGARSGKTFNLVRNVVIRALAVPETRHAILRFRFNHLKPSIILGTLPEVIKLSWPGLTYKLDKVDWFAEFPNGSQIWFGGLDEKERTEKILGQQYSTVYLNECSQIPWASRNMAVTRLAERKGLRLKMYYDCNPPSMAHWTYQVFVGKKNPDTHLVLGDTENYVSILMNPKDNSANLPDEYLVELQNLPPRERARFWDGQFADATEGALWSLELLDQQRYIGEIPEMQRIIIAVDPSGASGEEDKRSDEIGIVVVGLGTDGFGYVLEDLSLKAGPAQWGQVVVSAYDRWKADRVVAEMNFGGAMVEHVIKASRPDVPFRPVNAARGKVVRAEPIATLFEAQKIWLAGNFSMLEEQMLGMTVSGYQGNKSPDRVDAMVWGLTELFPAIARKQEPMPTRAPVVNMGQRHAAIMRTTRATPRVNTGRNR
jgi:phage terminase large subunit-like protein